MQQELFMVTLLFSASQYWTILLLFLRKIHCRDIICHTRSCIIINSYHFIRKGE